MARTVAALYDTRAEAELARSRLASEVNGKSSRIIAKQTAAAVDSLKFAESDVAAYRESVRRGGHLLIAEVPSNTSAERVIELLLASAGETEDTASPPWDQVQHGFQVSSAEPDGKEMSHASASEASNVLADRERVVDRTDPIAAQSLPDNATEILEPAADGALAENEARPPLIGKNLRVGRRQLAGGRARVSSFTRVSPPEEPGLPRCETIEVESGLAGRELTDSEVEAAGLFQERVFEIAEMREVPIITKVAVVREEVIVRKTVKERTETIRETVRHTEVDVADLAETPAPAFFTAEESSTAERSSSDLD